MQKVRLNQSRGRFRICGTPIDAAALALERHLVLHLHLVHPVNVAGAGLHSWRNVTWHHLGLTLVLLFDMARWPRKRYLWCRQHHEVWQQKWFSCRCCTRGMERLDTG